MTTCRLPTCDRPAGHDDATDAFARAFCSVKHELKYEDVRADARDARRADREGDR